MNSIISYPTLFVVLISAAFSCKKGADTPGDGGGNNTGPHDEKILSYSIDGHPADVTFEDSVIHVRFPDTSVNVTSLSATFTLSAGCTATAVGTTQVSGQTKNNYTTDIIYNIQYGNNATVKRWVVTAANNDYTYGWGLGHILTKAVSNNRSYDFYMGQAGTGPYATINCGPTTITMAMRWADSTFTQTPADARTAEPTQTGLWYETNMEDYLRLYKIPYIQVHLADSTAPGAQVLENEIDKGRVVAIIIDASQIRRGDIAKRADRYYDNITGHCILLKGYRRVDGQDFFEAYDPWSYPGTYQDGTPDGKNRYYRAEDIVTALKWNGSVCTSVQRKN